MNSAVYYSLFFWLFLISSPFISGCQLKKPAPDDSKIVRKGFFSETFYIKDILGESIVVDLNEDFSFPRRKRYHFSVCINDINSNTPIYLDLFEVAKPDGSDRQKLKVNQSGCHYWSEDFDFNYLNPSRFLEIKRKLIGQGAFKGEIDFNFAINPWLHGPPGKGPREAEVVDITKNATRTLIPYEKIQTHLLSNERGFNEFLVNDARLTIKEVKLESGKGGTYEVDIRFRPLMKIYDEEDRPHIVPILKGQFNLVADLVVVFFADNKNHVVKLNANSINKTESILSDALIYSGEMLLPFAPSRGRYELLVRLVPEQKEPIFKPFEGVYIISENEGLKGNFLSRIKANHSSIENARFNFKDYVTGVGFEGLNNEKTTYKGFRPLKYEFNPLQFFSTGFGKDQSLEREILFRVKACIKNGADSSPLKIQEFEIKKFNGTVTKVESRIDSCIYWEDSLSHEYYVKQNYYEKSATITNKSLGIYENLCAYLQPWNINQSRDCRGSEDEVYDYLSSIPKREAMLILERFSYQLHFMNYEVDPWLNIIFRRNINLSLEPRVKIDTSLEKGLADWNEPLRDGLYYVESLVTSNSRDELHNKNALISNFENIAMLHGGRMVIPMTIAVKDYHLLQSRNNLYVRIAPIRKNLVQVNSQGEITPVSPLKELKDAIDWNSGLSPRTFVSTIEVAKDEDTRDFLQKKVGDLVEPFIESEQGRDRLLSGQIAGVSFRESDISLEEVKAKAGKRLDEEASLFEKNRDPRLFAEINQLEFIDLRNSKQVSELGLAIYDPLLLQRRAGSLAETSLWTKTLIDAQERESFIEKSQTNFEQIIHSFFSADKLNAKGRRMLCEYWVQYHLVKVVDNRLNPLLNLQRALNSCMTNFFNERESFFKFEKRLHPERVEKIDELQSLVTNFNLNSSFNLLMQHSNFLTESVGLTFFNFGLSHKFNDYFNVGMNGNYAISKGITVSDQTSANRTVNAGTNLNLKQVPLKLKLYDYQKCLTIKLNPNLFNPRISDFRAHLHPSLTHEELAKIARAGFYLCDTQIARESVEVIETYYMLSGGGDPGGVLDRAELKNRPFLFLARGPNAFSQFIDMLNEEVSLPESESELRDSGLPHLRALYRSIGLMAPTVPGTYSVPWDMNLKYSGLKEGANVFEVKR